MKFNILKQSNPALFNLCKTFIVFVSLTVLLSSCGAATLDKKYDCKDFSLSYPSSWALSEVSGGVDLVENNTKITIKMSNELSSKINDVESINRMASNLRQSLKGKIIINETREIAQNNVLWIETRKDDGLTVVYPFDHVVYIIQLEDGDHTSNVMATAREIAESFIPKTRFVDVEPKQDEVITEKKKQLDSEIEQNQNDDSNDESSIEMPLKNKPVIKQDFTSFDDYMFKMPIGWERDGYSSSLITLFYPKEKKTGTFVSVATQIVLETDLVNEIAQEMRNAIAPKSLIVEVKTFDGVGYRYEYKTDDGKKEAQTVVKKGNKLYLLSYAEGNASFWNEYEQIVSTFIPK